MNVNSGADPGYLKEGWLRKVFEKSAANYSTYILSRLYTYIRYM